MSRLAPLLLSISRQNVQYASKAAIRQTTAVHQVAAISVSSQRQISYAACRKRPACGRQSVSRSLLEINHSKPINICWYSSAAQEDDINVFYSGLVNRIESGDIQLIDVREPDELKGGQITNSINIPLGQVKEAFEMPEDKFEARYGRPKPSTSDDNIVFSCRSGKRSLTALGTAKAQGFSLARHFPGGWLEWAKENNLPGA